MTEAEWLASDDPTAMLGYLDQRPQQAMATNRRRISDRKLRLFTVACVRAMMPRPMLIAETENLAEVECTIERGGTFNSDGPFWWILSSNLHIRLCAWWHTLTPHPLVAAAALLREIAGNPFRPLLRPPAEPPNAFEALAVLDAAQKKIDAGARYLDVRWLTPTVVSLAQAAYEERRPDSLLCPERLAILADALEDAGCTDEAILGHLRGPGPHVRGCHVLDLLLERSNPVDMIAALRRCKDEGVKVRPVSWANHWLKKNWWIQCVHIGARSHFSVKDATKDLTQDVVFLGWSEELLGEWEEVD